MKVKQSLTNVETNSNLNILLVEIDLSYKKTMIMCMFSEI